jgi:hypothetical protein
LSFNAPVLFCKAEQSSCVLHPHTLLLAGGGFEIHFGFSTSKELLQLASVQALHPGAFGVAAVVLQYSSSEQSPSSSQLHTPLLVPPLLHFGNSGAVQSPLLQFAIVTHFMISFSTLQTGLLGDIVFAGSNTVA